MAKFIGEHLCSSHISIKLQVSSLKIHQKETPAQVVSCEFTEFFLKTVLSKHLWMAAPADCSFRTKILSIDRTFFVFSCVFSERLWKWSFLLFTLSYQKITWMLLRQFRLSNNLPTHITKNTDFPRQTSWQLPSVAANFKCCDIKLNPAVKKKCLKNIYNMYFSWEEQCLFQAVFLIEMSSKLMKEKAVIFAFRWASINDQPKYIFFKYSDLLCLCYFFLVSGCTA